MRRILGTILTLLVFTSLAACGSDETGDETATDPTRSATTRPTSSADDGPVDFTEVALVSETAAGGTVSDRATALAADDAVQAFSEQFEGTSIARKIASEVDAVDVPDGEVIAAAVISIGCDVPPGVSVTKSQGVLLITALKVRKPLPECFAAVTTVALVLVDQALFN